MFKLCQAQTGYNSFGKVSSRVHEALLAIARPGHYTLL